MEKKMDYYKAYEKRYFQVYEKEMLWSSKKPTPDVLNFLTDYKVSKKNCILDLGCGEGRDAIYLLNDGYNVLAADYSQTVIDKCNELSDFKFASHFMQFDIMDGKMEKHFDYIYSIAVLHMFVLEEHRNKFLSFIREHLTKNGRCLICVLGDGNKEYETNIDEAFKNTKRIVMNNDTPLEIAATSCKIVNWKTLEKEMNKNKLVIEKRWISTTIPEFAKSMCVIVKR